MKKIKLLIIIISMFTLTSCKKETNGKEQNIMINLTIRNQNFKVALEDNDTVKELVKLLPLNIKMNNLNGNEIYYYLDKNLPSNDHNIKEIKKGDIMLYNSCCLVIFYKSFKSSYSYTKIGKIIANESLDTLIENKDVNVLWSKEKTD